MNLTKITEKERKKKMISADLTDKNAIIIFPFQSTGTQMIVVGLKT